MNAQCKRPSVDATQTIVVAGVDATTVARLRDHAAKHGRSLDAEIADVLAAYALRLSRSPHVIQLVEDRMGADPTQIDRGLPQPCSPAIYKKPAHRTPGLQMLLDTKVAAVQT